MAIFKIKNCVSFSAINILLVPIKMKIPLSKLINIFNHFPNFKMENKVGEVGRKETSIQNKKGSLIRLAYNKRGQDLAPFYFKISSPRSI